MKCLVLLCSLLGVIAHAQVPLPSGRPNPYPQRLQGTIPRDQLEWNGPLVPLGGQSPYYRTFGVGLLPHAPTIGVIAPGTTLIGFEISGIPGAAVSSLQPYYLSNGVRSAGTVIGELKGVRSQLMAREGYAVREVRLSSVDEVTGFHVIFGRIQADGTLSDTDIYSSDQNGRGVLSMNAGGLPLCGVLATGRQSVDGLALLVSQGLVTQKKPTLAPTARMTAAGQTNAPTPVAGVPPGVNPPPPAAARRGRGLPPGVYPADPSSAAQGILPTNAPTPTIAPPVLDAADLAEAGALVNKTGDSLVFVEGENGRGSAFVCTLNGKRVLLTNQHVIRGNPRMRFTTLNQAAVQIGPARAAAGHDIIAYDLAEALPALEVATEFQSVTVGDKVVVLGNTEGARVIKPLPGTVVGVGPNLVEISSEFLPGNSGSPIVHVKTGKVIGIATYAIVRDVNSLTGEKAASVRRFGYRIDSVQNWQPVNWAIYQAEALATQKISDFSSTIIRLFAEIRDRRFNPSNHTDTRLRPAIAHLSIFDRRGIVEQDLKRGVQNFLGEIRNATQRDVNDLRPRLQYDFFRRELAEEAKFRAEIYKGIGEAMARLR